MQERRLSPSFWRRIIGDIVRIMPFYSKMNKIMSLGFDQSVRRYGIMLLEGCKVCIDLGSGPGDSIVMLSRACNYTVGVEPSPELAAMSLSRCKNVYCDIVISVAEYLPFRVDSIDCVSSFFASRDFMSLDESLRELSRVATCKTVIGDIFLPSNPLIRILELAWVCLIVPLLALFFARKVWRSYTTICKTLRGWISADRLASKLTFYGWSEQHVKSYVFGALGVVYAARKGSRSNKRC